jgi:hypothetical protein
MAARPGRAVLQERAAASAVRAHPLPNFMLDTPAAGLSIGRAGAL